MIEKRLFRCLVMLALLAFSAINGSQVRAQDQAGLGGGIDLVMLVDISRSNWDIDDSADGKPKNLVPGSDRDRLRWDAVKLVLDLLGPTDRLMVQRFNAQSPPQPLSDGTTEQIENSKNYFAGLERLKYFKPSDEFTPDLQFLSVQNRAQISAKTLLFNRTDDEFRNGDVVAYTGVLDFAGTRIVHALQVVEQRIQRRVTGRQTHVIVLTDGLDDDYKEDPYDESVLEKKLKFFVDGAPIPIHTLGLNLDAQGKVDAAKARKLLRGMSHITGGEFKEAATSADLIPFFLKFMEKIKGYWRLDLQEKELEDGIAASRVGGIIELGVMNYVVDQKVANDENADKKFVTKPPEKRVEFKMLGLDNGAKTPLAELRTGQFLRRVDKIEKLDQKEDSIYHFHYFGPPANANGKVGKSPFAGLPRTANLTMQINNETDPQKLILLKGTAKLFELVEPAPKANFQRTQNMVVRVSMADSEYFKPRNFKITAKIAIAGQIDDSEAAKEYSLIPEAAARDDHATDFVLRVPLTGLPFVGPDQERYEIAVSIDGIQGPDQTDDHALSGSRHDLPGRTFSVDNIFALDPLANVQLTEKKLVATIPVAATFKNVVDKLELNFQFEPPSIVVDGKPERLKADLFTIEPADGKLVLTKGKGTIKITLNSVENLDRDNPYSPGRIVLNAPVGIPMKPKERAATISLSVGRSSVVLNGTPARLTNPQRTKTGLTVSLAPDQPPIGSEVTITLEPVEPDRKGGVFDVVELWLSKAGNVENAQSITAKLDEPFFIEVNDNKRGESLKGVFKYRIKVENKHINSVSQEFLINIQAPQIVIEKTEATVHLSRGKSPLFEVNAWLTSSVKERIEKAYIKDVESGQGVSFFQDSSAGGRHMIVHCPDKSSPVELRDITDPNAQADRKTLVSFKVEVPSDIAYGHYWRDFEIVGGDVVGKTFRINIFVDGLEVDFFVGKDETTGKDKYTEKGSEEFVQFYRTTSTRRLRIRTGRNEPLSQADIQVSVIGDFRDDEGDVQERPNLKSELINDKRELLVTIKFPKVQNANVDGKPYRVRVQAESKKETLKVPHVEFQFNVRILSWKQVLPSAKK